ncbi:hypothetical protein ACMT4L_14075 [Deinococcus sp. A31D244]|uniref:DUF4384 domain-containing protein n=1 Tax=Deinococcus aquaticus TaxID=328692 RepID=A0ABY7V2X1_9DEIO|nr:hypothetical protein [Deinococcus aquaticus]WDA59536.1 hypothetical protein M8445_04805 [Deinococcus aquaticus]
MKTALTALLSLSVLTAQSALAQTTRTVFINGVALQATPVQKGGQTYYQFSETDLKRVGAITAGGVTPNTDAIRGCVGDTLFNGVYTVQLLQVGLDDDRFTAKLRVSNASKQELHNFMIFAPGDLYVANGAANATSMPNYDGQWIDTLLPGTNVTLQASTGSQPAGTNWTRLLIRPPADAIKELQQAKLPLARIYNMEFDLTCTRK